MEQKEEQITGVLTWQRRVNVPHAVVWHTRENAREPRAVERAANTLTARRSLSELFAAEDFPTECAEDDVLWRRDSRGKPFVEWQGAVAEWAAQCGKESRFLHVSNTHDGNAHLVFAVYTEQIVGIGIDAVYLPRLRRPGRDTDYLWRLAARFMSDEEQSVLRVASLHEDEEALRMRVAAHFSLMESASKALGTGLRLGIGMSRATALPPQSLGVAHLTPEVGFLFGPEAEARLAELNAGRYEGHWALEGDYLVSAVLVWQEERGNDV